MSSDSEDQYVRKSKTRKKTMGANSRPVAKCTKVEANAISLLSSADVITAWQRCETSD